MKFKYAPLRGQTVFPANVGDVGFEANARVRTPRGDVPARALSPGDVVLTRRGPRRLLDSIHCILAPKQVRVRIKTFAFTRDGTGELTHGAGDLILLPNQRIVLRDWRARIMFGQEIAAPPVSRLIDGENARYDTGTFLPIQLLFLSQPEVVCANGVELASADAKQKGP